MSSFDAGILFSPLQRKFALLTFCSFKYTQFCLTSSISSSVGSRFSVRRINRNFDRLRILQIIP